MAKYVSYELDLEDKEVDLLIWTGMLVRRGNQHGSSLYLTPKGSEALRAYLESRE